MRNKSSFKEILLGESREDCKCIWWMNIGAEELWASGENHIIPRLSVKNSGSIISNAEQMCLLLADDRDIVIMKDEVSPEVIESLKTAGFDLPEIWYVKNDGSSVNTSISELILKNLEIIDRIRHIERISSKVSLVPYAVTVYEKQISEATGCKIAGASPETSAWINNKINARILAEDAGLPITEGFICNSADEVIFSIRQLRKSENSKIVIKDAYGASGKGNYLIDSEKSLEYLYHILIRGKNRKKQFNVIVEKWYDTLADINYQIFIRNDGTVIFIPPKKQLLDGMIYRGSDLYTYLLLSNEEIEIYREAANTIGKKLYEKGYRGIASIDSIITKENVIYPVIEINGRFSLSTYISFIPKLMAGTKYFKSKYYYAYTETMMSQAIERIRRNNYKPEKREGLLLYSCAQKTDTMPGRIFILYAYNDLDRLHTEERYFADISAEFKEVLK